MTGSPSETFPQPWAASLANGLFLVALAVFAERVLIRDHFLAYLAVTLFGALVGATELVARYRDEPVAPLMTVPGMIYVGVNGAVSLAVFGLLRSGQLATGVIYGVGPELNQMLVASFGSMALFRTSLFQLRIKDTDVAIGPAVVLQVILDAADRACDRLRAGPRAQEVKQIMAGVSYAQAKSALVLHCLALMQNLSAAEQTQISQAIAVLDGATMSDEVKSYNLGLLLINYVGRTVLQEAVRTLGSLIIGPAPDVPPIFSQAAGLKFSDMTSLISFCAALDPKLRESDVAAMRVGWLTVDAALTRDADRNIVVLARLRRYFGAETLSRALALLAISNNPPIKVPASLSIADLK